MGIPISALRRAIQEMADMDSRASMRQALPRALSNTVQSAAAGAPLGAMGGLLTTMPGSDDTDLDAYSSRLMGNVGRGALIGAGVGAGASGLVGVRGGLRKILAEMAAERGIGRAADRLGAHAEDADRFGAALEGKRPRPVSHTEPDAIEPDMDVDDMLGGSRFQDPSDWFRAVARSLSPKDQEILARNATDIPSGIEVLRKLGYSDDMIREFSKGVDWTRAPVNRGGPYTSGMGRTGYD